MQVIDNNTKKKFWMLVEEKQDKKRNKDISLCFPQGIISQVQNSPGHAGPPAKGSDFRQVLTAWEKVFCVGGLSYH